MSASSSNMSDDSPRKRMRKGTHSCAECRRRKKSCIPHPGTTNTCTECFARHVQCRDQQPDQVSKRSAPESKQNLQQRVTELEAALYSIANKLDNPSNTHESENDATTTLKQIRSEILPPTPGAPSIVSSIVSSSDARLENAPVLSLFDNAILSRFQDDGGGTDAFSATTPMSENGGNANPKIDRIRKTLLSLFPPPDVQEAILNASQSWWNATQDVFPQIYGHEPGSTVSQFIAESKSSGCVQKIAKALLCISICLQEAPPNFDVDICPLAKMCGKDITSHNMNVINDLVISDDDIASTIDGIECLFLQAKFDGNEGHIRKAWIGFRRALSFAQLLGFHVTPKYSQRSKNATLREESLWKALYASDRFLSLILGLPYAVSELHCSMSACDSSTPKDHDTRLVGENYIFQLSTVVGHVIDRNQEPPSNNTLPSTIKIEAEMTDLAAAMPDDWWVINPDIDDIASQMYCRFLPQFWHHQARTLLHLPFMLKAATDRRYEYNRIAALESAREMINRYRIFRPAQGFGSLVCKVVDFQIFTAAMVLVLNLLGTSPSSSDRDRQEAEADEELIRITTDLLHRASLETEGGVTTQAARALKMFCKTRAEPCPAGQTTARVVIPYFGTVVFGPGTSFANQKYLKPSSSEAAPQPVQLPTPEMEVLDSSPQDNSATGFDNFLATMPSGLSFGGYPLQQPQDTDIDGGIFANANLDLDQDWSWFWNNTDIQL